eukprot:5504799-Prymnesium_polylepis.1
MAESVRSDPDILSRASSLAKDAPEPRDDKSELSDYSAFSDFSASSARPAAPAPPEVKAATPAEY